jgi:tetratricopeptide (TPR) repeat protein
MSTRVVLLVLILAACVVSPRVYIPAAAAAQGAATQDASSIKADADKAYTAQDWKKAAALYGELTKTEPQSGFAWFRLGNALRRNQQYPEALTALEKARMLGFQSLITQAMIAGVYSASGETKGSSRHH